MLTFYFILLTATPGEVVNVFMAILIGSISLAQLAPEVQAINHACGAAAKLYETIDRIPDIDSSNSGGLTPKKSKVALRSRMSSSTIPPDPTWLW